ncbi:MAG: NarK/NasA family nitrate transporter [Deltaproteobacteria bacterium]|nr:NarK/NasA family nitrate transporter [Deltaproteobacteria bacterium]
MSIETAADSVLHAQDTNRGAPPGGGKVIVADPALAGSRRRVLWLSTIGFTVLFAVWLMFGVLGISLRKELGLTPVQLSWLTAVAVLNGSIWRLFFGILADREGGRRVFAAILFFTAIPAFLVSRAQTYNELLLYGFLVGIAGNSFSVGIAWNSAWFPPERQGFALGVFGAGNVGASATKLIGPALIAAVPAVGYLGGFVPGGWRFLPFLYAVLCILTGLAVWLVAPARDLRPSRGRPLLDMVRPLKHVEVWRFSLYYVVVFGAYVALAAWLPRYYVDVYGLPLAQAALLTTLFIFPASLLRPVGGWLSDRYGARHVMYASFGAMLVACAFLALPNGHAVVYVPTRVSASGTLETLHYHVDAFWFTVLVVIVGVAMGVGKAAVYKYIPEYFPKDVGAVGGLVGLLGALGGFFLPPLFAYAELLTGLPQTTFGILFLLTLVSLAWLHLTVMGLLQSEVPELRDAFEHRVEGEPAGEPS